MSALFCGLIAGLLMLGIGMVMASLGAPSAAIIGTGIVVGVLAGLAGGLL